MEIVIDGLRVYIGHDLYFLTREDEIIRFVGTLLNTLKFGHRPVNVYKMVHGKKLFVGEWS